MFWGNTEREFGTRRTSMSGGVGSLRDRLSNRAFRQTVNRGAAANVTVKIMIKIKIMLLKLKHFAFF